MQELSTWSITDSVHRLLRYHTSDLPEWHHVSILDRLDISSSHLWLPALPLSRVQIWLLQPTDSRWARIRQVGRLVINVPYLPLVACLVRDDPSIQLPSNRLQSLAKSRNSHWNHFSFEGGPLHVLLLQPTHLRHGGSRLLLSVRLQRSLLRYDDAVVYDTVPDVERRTNPIRGDVQSWSESSRNSCYSLHLPLRPLLPILRRQHCHSDLHLAERWVIAPIESNGEYHLEEFQERQQEVDELPALSHNCKRSELIEIAKTCQTGLIAERTGARRAWKKNDNDPEWKLLLPEHEDELGGFARQEDCHEGGVLQWTDIDVPWTHR